jgi:hypothetical protein
MLKDNMIVYFEDKNDGETFLRVCKLIAYILDENEKFKL